MKKSSWRNRRALGIAAVTAALLVPLGVFGAPALARTAAAVTEYEYGGGGSQYQYKITICHHTHSKKHPTHTIKVSVNAWKAHQRHGDTMGACLPAAPTNTSSTTKHGKSGEQHGSSNAQHGNGKGHGK